MAAFELFVQADREALAESMRIRLMASSINLESHEDVFDAVRADDVNQDRARPRRSALGSSCSNGATRYRSREGPLVWRCSNTLS